MKFYKSNVLGMAGNTRYPHEIEVNQTTNNDKTRQIFNKDYVCALYKEFKRSSDNFVISDCLALDCDNDYSDDPNAWITPDHLISEFDNVFMIFHMDAAGFVSTHPHNKVVYHGITLLPEYEDDFLA